MLLTSGVIGGGTRSYGFRLDLRVVYQALCHNHPLPDEPAYPLWSGLPAGSTLTRDALRQRIDDCLGLDREASQRTPEQARRLRTIVDVIRIPASSVQAHMAWATWHFQDIALHRSGGGNPFGNDKVRYRGSDDDAALDAAVLRYPVDPAARARFGADTDPTGRIEVPVLTVHGIDDPTAFVELEDSFRRTMTEAGRGDRLVQTFVKRASHSYLGDATYPPAFEALLRWVETGEKPTPEGIAARCPVLSPQAPPKEACAYVPGYAPASLETRVPPR